MAGILSTLIQKKWGDNPKGKGVNENLSEAEQIIMDEYNEQVHSENGKPKQLVVSAEILEQIFTKTAKIILPFNQEFKFDKSNQYFIKTLIYYFSNNEKFTQSEIIKNTADLNKGLLITGSCGLGKTTVLKVFHKIFHGVGIKHYNKSFSIKSCNEIVSSFNKNGTEAIEKYFKKGNWLFDDFGTEKEGRYFGNKEETMEIILEERYNAFLNNTRMTYLTTNLTMAQINIKYGFRVKSRLPEMFNIIELKGEDRRADNKAEDSESNLIKVVKKFVKDIETN